MHAGYHITELLYESANSKVYRALRQNDGLRVIMKVPSKVHPENEELLRFRSEFTTLSDPALQQIPLVIKAIDLIENGLGTGVPVLVLEDIGAESLQRLLNEKTRVSLEDVLSIALGIAKSLIQIHAIPMLHKDISPGNIIWNGSEKLVRLIDFGLSSKMATEVSLYLTGTLPYISPEQTGRMNRTIDLRSDLYSFGATLYHLLSGTPPFDGITDELELIHCHIARTPNPPFDEQKGQIRQFDERSLHVAKVLSNTIMRLLQKNAEDRYQSPSGLFHDLEKCWSLLKGTLDLKESFVLGLHDIPITIKLPQNLYGRSYESTMLMDKIKCTERTASSAFALVTGCNGVGKRSLLVHVEKMLVGFEGCIVYGKFEKDMPLSGLVGAIEMWIDNVLRKPLKTLKLLKDGIDRSTSPLLRALLCQLVPSLTLLLGAQSTTVTPAATSSESLTRTKAAFITLLKTMTSKDNALVIILENLQFADILSMRIMDSLTQPEVLERTFITFLADDSDPLYVTTVKPTFESVTLRNVGFDRIELLPLRPDDVHDLLKDTLRQPQTDSTFRDAVKTLSVLIHEKTGGIPRCVHDYIRELGDRRFIKMNFATLCWEWDLAAIDKDTAAANTLHLTMQGIATLPQEAKDVLKLASLLGSTQFELYTLVQVSKRDVGEINAALQSAIKHHLIVPLTYWSSRISKEMDAKAVEELMKTDQCAYAWQHIRIRDLFETLLAETEKEPNRKKYNVFIALREQLEAKGDDTFGKRIWCAKLFLQAFDSLVPGDCTKVYTYLYDCGVRAMTMNEFSLAVKMLEGSVMVAKIMYPNAAQRLRNIASTVDMYCLLCEAFLLTGNFKEMFIVDEILPFISDMKVKAQLTGVKIAAMENTDRKGLIPFCHQCLKEFGLSVPLKLNKFYVIRRWIQLKSFTKKFAAGAYKPNESALDNISLGKLAILHACSELTGFVECVLRV